MTLCYASQGPSVDAAVVMALLPDWPDGLTRRDVERTTGLPTPRVIEALRALTAAGVVAARGRGRARRYRAVGADGSPPEPWDLENLRMQLVGHAEQLERDAARARSAADALRP